MFKFQTPRKFEEKEKILIYLNPSRYTTFCLVREDVLQVQQMEKISDLLFEILQQKAGHERSNSLSDLYPACLQ